jgi:hypothetical protein
MTEAKTLEELLKKYTIEVAPHLDDIAARILKEHPEIANPKGEMVLGRLIGIALLDTLCHLYGKPSRGYLPLFPKN